MTKTIKTSILTHKLSIYSCMVDLYSRAELVKKALVVPNNMPFRTCAMIWRSLLVACRVHKNLEIGTFAYGKLMPLKPQDEAGYVLLSSVYATSLYNERKKNGRRNLMVSHIELMKNNFQDCVFFASCNWFEYLLKDYNFLLLLLLCTLKSSRHRD